MEEKKQQKGFTLIEILTVCVLIALIASFAIPSYMQARRVTYEDNAIGRLRRIALAESRYYTEYSSFGDFRDLTDTNFLPKGYSTRFDYLSPVSESSILPFIDRYSLVFYVPASANSLFYKIDAIPAGNNQMGLRTFNINLFLTGTTTPNQLISIPPVREGLDIDGDPITDY
ncbi:MAG: type II secretion system protein [bacterium]